MFIKIIILIDERVKDKIIWELDQSAKNKQTKRILII